MTLLSHGIADVPVALAHTQDVVAAAHDTVLSSINQQLITAIPTPLSPSQYGTYSPSPIPVYTQTLAPIANPYIGGAVPLAATPSSFVPGTYTAITPAVIQNQYSNSGLDLTAIYNTLQGSINASQAAHDTSLNSAFSAIYNQINGLTTVVNGTLHGVSDSVNTPINITLNSNDNALHGIADSLTSTINNTLHGIDETTSNMFYAAQNFITKTSEGMQARNDDFLMRARDSVDSALHGIQETIDKVTGGVGSKANLDAQKQQADFFTSVYLWLINTEKDLNTLIADLPNLPERIQELFADIGKSFRSDINGKIDGAMKYENKQIEHLNNVYLNIINGRYATYTDMTNDLNTVLALPDVLQTVQNIILFVPRFIDILKAGYEQSDEFIKQLANTQYHPTLLDANTLAELLRRGETELPRVIAELEKQGFSSGRAAELVGATMPLKPLEILKEVYVRKVITEQNHDVYLRQYGFDLDTVNMIKELYHLIPNPTDLTRMADKHIFDDTVDRSFGQYTEYPKEYIAWMDKLGFDPDWSTKIWAAHWSLPSFEQIIEMFQRGYLSQDERDTYLRLTDLMPRFRDKLVSISYVPFTRVDIRRMYGLGVLKDTDLVKAYQDIGYSQENANKLAEFTRKLVIHGDTHEVDKVKVRAITSIENSFKHNRFTRDEFVSKLNTLGIEIGVANEIASTIELERETEHKAVRSKDYISRGIKTVQDAYSRHSITHSDALSFLQGLGLDINEGELELAYLDLQHDIKLKQLQLEHIETMYVSGVIDFNQLIQDLSNASFTGNEQQRVIVELNMKREFKNKKPTEAQITKMFNVGIIDEVTYIAELRGLGFADKYISWMLQLNAPVQVQ